MRSHAHRLLAVILTIASWRVFDLAAASRILVFSDVVRYPTFSPPEMPDNYLAQFKAPGPDSERRSAQAVRHYALAHGVAGNLCALPNGMEAAPGALCMLDCDILDIACCARQDQSG